jgi:hypothetical protein
LFVLFYSNLLFCFCLKKESIELTSKLLKTLSKSISIALTSNLLLSTVYEKSIIRLLGNLSGVLASRTDELIELLEEKSPQNLYQNTPDFLNP